MVIALKKGNWRKFLVECDDNALFKAYKYTKPSNSNSIAPLLNKNNNITSNKEEQARLLFKGTSDVPIDMNTKDIQPLSLNPPVYFPVISPTKFNQIINQIPKKKAKGHDNIPNEIIKWGQNSLIDILIKLFNTSLNLGYFPTFWKYVSLGLYGGSRTQEKRDNSIYCKGKKDKTRQMRTYKRIIKLCELMRIIKNDIQG
jgi:hypothetical protein